MSITHCRHGIALWEHCIECWDSPRHHVDLGDVGWCCDCDAPGSHLRPIAACACEGGSGLSAPALGTPLGGNTRAGVPTAPAGGRPDSPSPISTGMGPGGDNWPRRPATMPVGRQPNIDAEPRALGLGAVSPRKRDGRDPGTDQAPDPLSGPRALCVALIGSVAFWVALIVLLSRAQRSRDRVDLPVAAK